MNQKLATARNSGAMARMIIFLAQILIQFLSKILNWISQVTNATFLIFRFFHRIGFFSV